MEEHKRYFVCSGLKIHWNFKLLPKDFEAITLFGHVYDIQKKDDLRKFLKSYSGKVMVNHERIHTLQAKTFKTRYLGFYVYYLWYWIIGLFKYGIKNYASYYNIPFEREAFKNEKDFSYSASKWKDYC